VPRITASLLKGSELSPILNLSLSLGQVQSIYDSLKAEWVGQPTGRKFYASTTLRRKLLSTGNHGPALMRVVEGSDLAAMVWSSDGVSLFIRWGRGR